MGGMGRDFDGGYAEYTCPKVLNVLKIDPNGLPWEVVGAVPEMLQTSWGSLFKALKLQKSDRLLVRGGTTSVGLAAAAIARNFGCEVAGTTRNASEKTRSVMEKSGVSSVIVDDGKISEQLKGNAEKFDKVLELVGTTTLRDSLRCVKPGGIVCMTGIVGER
jgi:NADPH:quinone reductase-like Zn-dependent oxidoreductase